MKENKLYLLLKNLGIFTSAAVLTFLLIQIIEFGHKEYLNYKNPIEPGREMFLVNHEENPFEKHDTLWVKVLEVKSGYVRYEQKIGNWKDTSSSHIGWLRHFTPVR
jgi:hypothetical protein